MRSIAFKKGLTYLICLFFLLCAFIFVNRILLADAFSREEAQHGIYSAWLVKDIKTFDFGSFWQDTQRQMYWPFFHSYVQAPFFLVFGVSYFSARLLSFITFLLTLWLMYTVALKFSEKDGWKIGIMSIGLALTSPMMIRFASENTLEGLGAFIFLASFHLYTYCERNKLNLDYVVLALLVSLSVFTNYIYAYLIIPAYFVVFMGKLGVVSCNVIELSKKGEKAASHFLWWAYRKFIFVAVILTVCLIWLMTSAFSRKFMLMSQAIFKYSEGEPVSGIMQNLFYYPSAIISQYTFSPWIGVLIVLALLMPFIAAHYKYINKMFTFIWTVIILATFTISAKSPQLIYVIAPFLFLVFSATVFYIVRLFNNREHAKIFLAALFIPTLLSLPWLVSLYFPVQPEEKMSQVVEYFKVSTPKGRPFAAAMNLKKINPEVMAFHFWDWGAPVMVDMIDGERNSFDKGEYFLSIEIDSEGPTQAENIDDSVFRWNSFLADKFRKGEIKEFSSRRFEKLGLTAKIYQKQYKSQPAIILIKH